MTGESRWDALARDLAGGQVSRRTAIRRFGSGFAAAALPSFLVADEALAGCPPSRKCGSKCCPSGQKCSRGKCKCKGGLTKCGKKCRDLSGDPANCGSCGHACSAGQTCDGGRCTAGQSCTAAADCPPGPAGDCKRAACVSGTCGFVVDDSDLPFDGNPCTDDVCSGGVPSNPPRGSGVSCGTGMVCDGAGACVGCVTAADCPSGPPGDCKRRACVSGTCGFINDDADAPDDDGNPCTADICAGGVPIHPLKPSGTACGTNLVCNNAGQCVGCASDGDCPAPTNPCQARVCNSGTCGFVNVTNGAVCDDGNLCTTNTTCQGGVCTGSPVVCQPQDSCHTATCNPNTGQCTNSPKADGSACDDGNACTQSDTCQGGMCGGGSPVICQALDECHTAGTCNPATGTCSNPPKADGTQCSGGGTCQSGVCTTCPGAGSPCAVGVGQCRRTGVLVCDGNGGTTCDATPGSPVAETCNGLDDNCNGTVDDGFPTLGQSCTVGVGTCARTGTIVCNGNGTGTMCSATPGSPSAEICNGNDDNCNGTIDDGAAGVGDACTCGATQGTKICKGAQGLCCSTNGSTCLCF